MGEVSTNGRASNGKPSQSYRTAKPSKGRKRRNDLSAPLDPLLCRDQRAVQVQHLGKLISLEQVKDESIEWLLRNQIPLGCITVLDGSKAEGKSTLLYDIAARLTAGKPMPSSNAAPITGGAILLQAEDDLGATVKKNFLAAGGDAKKVRVFSKADTLHLDDPTDLALIQTAAKDIKAKLLVVDPITEFFSKNLKDERTIRESLRLLRALAASVGMAVVLVRHLTKSGTSALYRGLGGVAVINAARAALVVGQDPSSDDPYQHVLAFNAGNLPRERDISLTYRTVKRDDAIVIDWLGDSKYSAANLVAATHNADDHSQLQEACQVLYSILVDDGTPVPAIVVNKAAKEALVSVGTLKRAKKLLKVRSRRKSFVIEERGSNGKTELKTEIGWVWELPKDDDLLAPYKERYEREKAEDGGSARTPGEVAL